MAKNNAKKSKEERKKRRRMAGALEGVRKRECVISAWGILKLLKSRR
jgi:hypothetical protein